MDVMTDQLLDNLDNRIEVINQMAIDPSQSGCPIRTKGLKLSFGRPQYGLKIGPKI